MGYGRRVTGQGEPLVIAGSGVVMSAAARQVVRGVTFRRWCLLLAIGVCLSGCLAGVRRNVEETARASAILGSVTGLPADSSAVVVAVVRQQGAVFEPYNYTHINKQGRFVVRVETDASFRVVAFDDLNRNLQPDSGEALVLADRLVAIGREAEAARVELSFGSTGPEVSAALLQGLRQLPSIRQKPLPVVAGKVATLDDARFSAEYGEQGLWHPFDFITDIGVGIYFLEPYDAKRIPVLFVNGAGGSPQDWRSLIGSLDRDRFQPWVYLYPSGARLESSADTLHRLLIQLKQQRGMQRMVVVAHSMGGLVARGALIKLQKGGHRELVRGFVSISSPWRGHAAAKLGVELAPATVPSWIDMVPGSAYQRYLFATPLDSAYHLLFGFRGGSAVFSENNDGTVTLASQLFDKAQDEAETIYGFDEGHVTILSNKAVSERLAALLEQLDVCE